MLKTTSKAQSKWSLRQSHILHLIQVTGVLQAHYKSAPAAGIVRSTSMRPYNKQDYGFPKR